jgi:hypothetical protein
MASLKCKVGFMKQILNSIKLSGVSVKGKNSQIFENCILTLDKKTNTISSLNIEGHQIVIADVKTKLTTEKGSIIKQGSMPLLINKTLSNLNRFNESDVIHIEHKNGKVIIKLNKSSNIRYSRKAIMIEDVDTSLEKNIFKYVKKGNYWHGNTVEYKTYFEINSAELEEIIKDAKEIDFFIYNLYIDKKNVKFSIVNTGNEDTASRTLTSVESLRCNSDVESIYGIGTGNIFLNLTGKVKCWVDNGEALIFEHENNGIKSVYILAPYNGEDEEEEEEDEDNSNGQESEENKVNKELAQSDDDENSIEYEEEEIEEEEIEGDGESDEDEEEDEDENNTYDIEYEDEEGGEQQ